MHVKEFFIIVFLLTLTVSLSLTKNTEAGSPSNYLMAGSNASSKAYRKSTVGEGAMTEEMLKNCIFLKRDIDAGGTELKKSKPQVDSVKKKLEDLAAYLKSNKDSIGHSDSKAIFTYNKNVSLYQSKATEYKSLQEEFNSKIDIYKQQRSKFDKECKDQKYYEDDYEKVVEKLGYRLD